MNTIPKHCRDCTYLWRHGIKQGGHDRWCCKYGKPAPAAESHCKLHGGKVPKEAQ